MGEFFAAQTAAIPFLFKRNVSKFSANSDSRKKREEKKRGSGKKGGNVATSERIRANVWVFSRGSFSLFRRGEFSLRVEYFLRKRAQLKRCARTRMHARYNILDVDNIARHLHAAIFDSPKL